MGRTCTWTVVTVIYLSCPPLQALQDDEDMVENGLSEDDCDTEDSFHHLTTGSSHKVKDKFLYSPDNCSPRFAVHVVIERAMHLPRVTEKNK